MKDDNSSIHTILFHTVVTGNRIPFYRSNYLPTNGFPRITQKILKYRIEPQVSHCVHHTDRQNEVKMAQLVVVVQLNHSSATRSGKTWMLKTAEQDEKHTVHLAKVVHLNQWQPVTKCIKYKLCDTMLMVPLNQSVQCLHTFLTTGKTTGYRTCCLSGMRN